ncbi:MULTISPECIES: outer membrane lipoprotein-sorting protein [Halanaerobium]|uniref:Outer membrane lipoprotein-sorting protein n=1 Tax=Halanaerobium kushneri TaxID=56779 RepID=A0A1N6SDM6_9FIRM|nr:MULTISPECIES: outer membrane lipoprotein-sorting protein [Halanaerobium]RCW57385.1 outer membrane lipoprotein-sorting protein [Halanaerobium sp. ST460_2HS_T2]SIQ39171.1 outer membrane lipoprotein-sorting protein [Halanaerobium kushneri]
MKIAKKIINLSILAALMIIIAVSIVNAANITGQEIIDKAEDNMDYGNYQSQAQMTIHTTGGDKRELKMEIRGEGTEKSIMKYYEPARIEGVTFLFIKDDIWSFFPRTGRVRHLAASTKNQKMMGSSFSYDDFSSEAFEDYSVKLIGNEKMLGEECYKVEGQAKSDEAAYDGFTAWVTEGDFRLLKVNYFKAGEKIKVMTIETFMKVNGKLRPKKITMKDLNEDNQTVFEYIEIETGVNFRPNYFNKRNLERISKSQL